MTEGTEEHLKLGEHFLCRCDSAWDQRGPSAAVVVRYSIATRCVIARSRRASDVLHRAVGLKRTGLRCGLEVPELHCPMEDD